jgi:hypothetical protein
LSNFSGNVGNAFSWSIRSMADKQITRSVKAGSFGAATAAGFFFLFLPF